jgi:hypothetical protein
MFDIIYQFRLNDMYNLLSADMVYYTQVQQHLSMLDMLLVGDRSIRYNRKMDKMFIDENCSLAPSIAKLAESIGADEIQINTLQTNKYKSINITDIKKETLK